MATQGIPLPSWLDQLIASGPTNRLIVKNTLLVERVKLLQLIGDMWRGDWTGSEFDGRDGSGWINVALSGEWDEVKNLTEKLEHWYD